MKLQLPTYFQIALVLSWLTAVRSPTKLRLELILQAVRSIAIEPRATSGYIAITTALVNPGVTFNILGNQFAPIQTTATHTAKIYVDNTLISTVPATVNAGGFFMLYDVSIPQVSYGVHKLKVTILPENLSNEIDIRVCGSNGDGCQPILFFADDPAHHSLTTFFQTTTITVGVDHRLGGDGFPVPNGPDPITNATVWVDRVCYGANAGPHCVETGHLIATTPVYHGNIQGRGEIGLPFTLEQAMLGPRSPHHLQVFVLGNMAQITFTT